MYCEIVYEGHIYLLNISQTYYCCANLFGLIYHINILSYKA